MSLTLTVPMNQKKKRKNSPLSCHSPVRGLVGRAVAVFFCDLLLWPTLGTSPHVVLARSCNLLLVEMRFSYAKGCVCHYNTLQIFNKLLPILQGQCVVSTSSRSLLYVPHSQLGASPKSVHCILQIFPTWSYLLACDRKLVYFLQWTVNISTVRTLSEHSPENVTY